MSCLGGFAVLTPSRLAAVVEAPPWPSSQAEITGLALEGLALDARSFTGGLRLGLIGAALGLSGAALGLMRPLDLGLVDPLAMGLRDARPLGLTGN